MSEAVHYRALLAVNNAFLTHRNLHSFFRELVKGLHSVVIFEFIGLALHKADWVEP